MTYHPGLADLAVTRCIDSADRLVVHADLAVAPPAEGVWRRHGWRTGALWDVPQGERTVQIVLRCPRFRDLDSGEIVQPRPAWLAADHRLTTRAVDTIRARWLHQPAAAVARSFGCSEKTVQRIVAADVAADAKSFAPRAPRRLGLDECHLGGRARAVLCDLDGARLVDIAPGYAETDVERLLRSLHDPERVEVVVIDCTPRYRAAIRKVLGDVPVVVDRWHIEKQARDALEAAVRAHEAIRHEGRSDRPLRRRLRVDRALIKKPLTKLTVQEKALLDVILAQDPGLSAAWAACQAFCALFASPNGAAAEAAYDAWRRGLTPTVAAVYRDLIRLVGRYRAEVFAYCDHHATNGAAENLNRRLKELSRLGGHQVPFATYRCRALRRFGGVVGQEPDAAPRRTATTAPPARGAAPSAAAGPRQLSLFAA